MNYTINKAVMQGFKPLNYVRTHYNCKPHSRCKQIHKCETCHNIHSKKQLDKHLNHITDKQLYKYKYAKYITITPNELNNSFDFNNAHINDYNDHLTNTGKRRAKKHPFNDCEYISFKEITKSKANGDILPHLHIILLTNNDNPLFDNPLFDYDIRDIEIKTNDTKYKKYNHNKNPLRQTLKNIYAYSTKADKARLSYEKTFDTSKGKNDVRVSKLFKSHKIPPIHIKTIAKIKSDCKQSIKRAKNKHSLYKQQKGNLNSLAVHKNALKTQRTIKRLQKKKKELIARAIAKLKRFSVRAERKKHRTHHKETQIL